MKNIILFNEFTKKFKPKSNLNPRGIGIECEFPIVNQEGLAVSLAIIHQLFDYLEKLGFSIEIDEYTHQPIAATRLNLKSALHFDGCKDTISTDLGFSTLEIALAPQQDLWTTQEQLNKILLLITSYFDQYQCRILGYGIQPFTPPSKDLLVPHKRYNFVGRVSGNEYVPISAGKDFHLLTVTASNQCHVEVSQEETIPAINVLNGLSGLQIALQANSSIWKGRVDANYKAIRELFWDYCFPDRLSQAGIPKSFNNLSDYLDNLMDFKFQRVIRNKQPYRIISENTFKQYYNKEESAIGINRLGEQIHVLPKPTDIHLHNGFCYYNARLVSKFGTIENRMNCQQPPEETMVTAALTLGILENLEESLQLLEDLSFISSKCLRMEAIKDALQAKLNGKSIIPWLFKLLNIAEKGLQNRGLGEAVFLTPLFHRLKNLQIPADKAISIFQTGGKEIFLETFSFNSSKSLQELYSDSLLENRNTTL